jgi:hypothetical protein
MEREGGNKHKTTGSGKGFARRCSTALLLLDLLKIPLPVCLLRSTSPHIDSLLRFNSSCRYSIFQRVIDKPFGETDPCDD